MTINLRGIIPACVVTLDEDGRFDEAAYRRYLQWLLPQGPVALAINADTGEGPHLWPDERARVLRVAVEEAGDVPVVAGLSAQFTAQAVDEANRAKDAGASALLVFPIPAYQGTPLDPAIPVAYHEAIASGRCSSRPNSIADARSMPASIMKTFPLAHSTRITLWPSVLSGNS